MFSEEGSVGVEAGAAGVRGHGRGRGLDTSRAASADLLHEMPAHDNNTSLFRKMKISF